MINILISVDSNYLDKAETMLFSMRMHTSRDITVYLMNHCLNDREISEFSIYLYETCNIPVVEIDVKETIMDSLPLGNAYFSIEMYYRILAQFYLPKSLDKILWLDADIVLLADVSRLYDIDFDSKLYLACEDLNNSSPWLESHKINLGLGKDHVYFNSGVLLINLKELRDGENLDQIVRKSYAIKDKLILPDQDILNCLYADNVKYVDSRNYNYQLTDIRRIPPDQLRDIVVLHYSGKNKPWNYWSINNTSKHYWKIRIAQGDRKIALKSYLLKLWDATYIYFREIFDVLG